MNKTLMAELQQRGLIAQTTNFSALNELLQQPQTVYCGFDPTAGSLHIGHLVPLMMLKRFNDAGHQIIALIGGATGMIGDPSFKATERHLNTSATVADWVSQLATQIHSVLATHCGSNVTIVNNTEWISGINVIDFLRDIGKHFTINAMLNRDSVKSRIQRPEQGISYTEFSYALLQSYDFVKLNKQFGCKLQIGGSDQWGNIVSGIDLTRRINHSAVYGLTLPLITKSDGTKFGKTEGGAVWLDPAKTSPYAFYQFWLNTPDEDVYRFLNYYTFLSTEQIAHIERQDHARTGKPQAQQILAEQVTQFVHGEQGLATAQRITHVLFAGEPTKLSVTDIKQLALDGLERYQVGNEQALSALLVTCGLAKSKRIAKQLLAEGAIKINGDIVTSDSLSQCFALFDRYWIIQRGKKAFRLLIR